MGVAHLFEDHFDGVVFHHAKNGKEALLKLNSIAFTVMILDVVLPDTDTHALLFETRRIQPQLKTLIYSNYPEHIYAMPYIKMGAVGYLNKAILEDEFVKAVKTILSGQVYISQDLMHSNINQHTNSFTLGNPFDTLSNRELEIFNHIIEGKKMTAIRIVMKIEQSTTSTLKKRLMLKLGVTNMVDLINMAKAYGY
jgi:DNA-binding NarL/FixJ family response regulator